MEEKIKVSLSKKLLELLKKDCVDFLIFNKNNTANMNLFINTLIANYYLEFCSNEEDLHDKIRKTLEVVPKTYQESVFDSFLKIINSKTDDKNEKNSCSLSFKPTAISQNANLYIETVISKNESISSFYRRLFTCYSIKTKNEREKIIFKQTFQQLSHAKAKEQQVIISLKNTNRPSNPRKISIYSVASSNDELFNYLLAYTENKSITVRLAKIESVVLTPTKSFIPNDCCQNFERQIACGVQYPIYNSDKEEIKVELTKNGQELFKKIYLYRPIVTKIEGDVYTFNCSANQVLYYFQRFGDSATILSPKKLGIAMRNYHWYAFKKYKSIYNKDL